LASHPSNTRARQSAHPRTTNPAGPPGHPVDDHGGQGRRGSRPWLRDPLSHAPRLHACSTDIRQRPTTAGHGWTADAPMRIGLRYS
jgi:hypothetical protein